MRVKFCGMTNLDDVLAAVDLGVDFIGFVFYEKSKRYVDYDKAKQIIDQIDKKVETVGVFVNQSDKEIKQAVNYCGLDYVQVYHDISDLETIRVYRIDESLPENIYNRGLMLFDSYTKSIGGSGVSFNFELIKSFEYKERLIVAGGVSIRNIERIAELNVFGVDLVSSVEEYPGKKSFNKMKEFMEVVRGL